MTKYIKNGHTIEVPDIDPTVPEGKGENFIATPQVMDALLREAGYAPTFGPGEVPPGLKQAIEYQLTRDSDYIDERAVHFGSADFMVWGCWSEEDGVSNVSVYPSTWEGEEPLVTYKYRIVLEEIEK